MTGVFQPNKESFTHDDLVDILSTGLYGNDALGIDYNKKTYNSLPDDKKEGDCIEDICADLLLAGKPIVIFDMYSEKTFRPGTTKEEMLKEMEWIDKARTEKCLVRGANTCTYWCGYTMTLDDLLVGMQICPEATLAFVKEEADIMDGDALLQCAIFGDVVLD